MDLKFKKSDEKSFNTYKTWFTDKELNKQLGPMDDETWEKWQEYHKIEKSEELAVYLNNELVGMVDISLPTKEHSIYCILALAIHPKKKRLGIGTTLLKYLLESGIFIDSKIWRAHVNPKNAPAITFFEKHGWEDKGVENDMITYRYITK